MKILYPHYFINHQKSEIERQNRFIESQNELICKPALVAKKLINNEK